MHFNSSFSANLASYRTEQPVNK